MIDSSTVPITLNQLSLVPPVQTSADFFKVVLTVLTLKCILFILTDLKAERLKAGERLDLDNKSHL